MNISFTTAAVAGTVGAGTGAVVTAAAIPTDWGGIASTIFAVCTFLAFVANWAATRKLAKEQRENKVKTDEKLEAVKTGVDGKMTEMIRVVSEKVAAETKLEVIAVQKVLEGADALAVQKAGISAVPLAVDESVAHALVEKENGSSATAKAATMIVEAAIKAKTLLETAATTAAALVIAAKTEAKVAEDKSDAKIEAKKEI